MSTGLCLLFCLLGLGCGVVWMNSTGGLVCLCLGVMRGAFVKGCGVGVFTNAVKLERGFSSFSFFLFLFLCFRGFRVVGRSMFSSSLNLDDSLLTSGYLVRNSSIVKPDEDVGECGSVWAVSSTSLLLLWDLKFLFPFFPLLFTFLFPLPPCFELFENPELPLPLLLLFWLLFWLFLKLFCWLLVWVLRSLLFWLLF